MIKISKKEKIRKIYDELDGIISIERLKERLNHYYFYKNITKNSRYNYYIKNCKKYFSLLNLAKKISNTKILDDKLNLSKGTSRRYLNTNSKPHLLRLALCIPKPKLKSEKVWLPLRNKMHHNPIDFIQAPSKIRNYKDILFVLEQLKSFTGYEKIDKEESFGYILGMMLSDISKPEGYNNSNQCLISLTRRYKWNLNIGNNLCRYFKSLGIKANRIKDNDKLRERAPYGEFRWISEKSPFNYWILKTCFGFSRKQRTTFDKVNCRWILNSSYKFRKAFLQGLCDGDGSAHNFWRVEISCDPNQELIVRLLKTFNIRSYIDKDAVCVANLDSLLSCNRLRIFKHATGRLKKLRKLSRIIKNKKPINLNKSLKEKIISLKRKNYSGGQISEHLFDKLNISINPNYINTFYRRNS